jgi:competence protein ComEA
MENQYLEKAHNWWSDLHYSSTQKRALAVVALLVLLISGLFVAQGNSQEVIAAPVAPQRPQLSGTLLLPIQHWHPVAQLNL